MASEDGFDLERVRAVLEQWVEGKQEAFAARFVDALRARGEELSVSTIKGAFSKAKGGSRDAIKQFFGTQARREAFAVAAGRPIAELDGQLAVAPSDRPVVLVVASDVAGGDMDSIARLTKALDAAGCAPRVVVDASLRRRLGEAASMVLDAWASKGWLVEAGFNGDGALQRTYDGMGTSRKAWVEGKTLSAGPRWQALRVDFRNGGPPTFDPPDFGERLQTRGFVAAAPAEHPEKTTDGAALKRTTLGELAAEAGVDAKTEPFVPQALEVGGLTGEWHAALVEIARGYPMDAVLAQRRLDRARGPKVLAALPRTGFHVQWGEGTRAVLLPGTWPAHPFRKFLPCAVRVEVNCIH